MIDPGSVRRMRLSRYLPLCRCKAALRNLRCLLAVGLLVATAPALADSIVVTLAPTTHAAATSKALAEAFGLKQKALRHLGSIERSIVTFELLGGQSRTALLTALRHDRRVETAQANFAHALAGMPVKDPYFDLQMRTERRGVAPLLQRASGRGVRVAVIDTGADTEHPDLQGQISEAINFVSGYSSIVPGEFHGTGVTGLIVARPGNGIGIHGLAPDAELIALRACWEPVYGYGLCRTDTLAHPGIARTIEEPNEGTRLAGRSAVAGGVRLAAAGWVVLGLIMGLLAKEQGGFAENMLFGLLSGIPLGLLVGATAFFYFGGRTVIRNRMLLWMLRRFGYLPRELTGFLEQATSAIVLQRTGGSYRFVHRYFLEYFADFDQDKR